MTDQTVSHDPGSAETDETSAPSTEHAASRLAGGDGRDAILEVENLRMYFPVKSSGVIRRRVYTSLFSSSARRSASRGQSSQTALNRRPVIPSLSADARYAASAAPFFSGAPPTSRCFSDRS